MSGDVAYIRLQDGSYEKDGKLYVDLPDWEPIPFVLNVVCNHGDGSEDQSTMCRDCVETWSYDYDVKLPDGVEL